MCPILRPLVPLFWISSDVCSGFQSQSGLPYLHCGGKCNVRSLRSISGATHANLLVASLPPVLSPHTVAEVRLPGLELVLSEYLWVRRSTNWAKPGRAHNYWNNLDLTKLVWVFTDPPGTRVLILPLPVGYWVIQFAPTRRVFSYSFYP